MINAIEIQNEKRRNLWMAHKLYLSNSEIAQLFNPEFAKLQAELKIVYVTPIHEATKAQAAFDEIFGS